MELTALDEALARLEGRCIAQSCIYMERGRHCVWMASAFGIASRRTAAFCHFDKRFGSGCSNNGCGDDYAEYDDVI